MANRQLDLLFDQTRHMLIGELRSKVDALWSAFRAGGVANPIEVVHQMIGILTVRRSDDLHTVDERKAQRAGAPNGPPADLRKIRIRAHFARLPPAPVGQPKALAR